MRTQIIELGTMKDLLNISKHYIFRMNFGELYVYYSGATSESFVGLNVFFSKEKIDGYVTISGNKVIVKESQDPHSIVIVPVKNDTVVRNVLANYIVATRGISEDAIDLAADRLKSIFGRK